MTDIIYLSDCKGWRPWALSKPIIFFYYKSHHLIENYIYKIHLGNSLIEDIKWI